MSSAPHGRLLPAAIPHFLDHKKVDWPQAVRAQHWLYQRFRYTYPGPVRDMRQRLIVVPPQSHGDQHLESYHIAVSVPASLRAETDGFGNRVFTYSVPFVEQTVDFEVWARVERRKQPDHTSRVAATTARRYLEPTRLTTADAALHAAASDLAAHADAPAALVERINTWTYNAMHYRGGITHVGTTAAEALALGQGLCQDYTHIMLTLCRLAGIPARYVSGHLLGEGGSHAWVEVLLPGKRSGWEIGAFDPTNHRRVGLNYITIATGRDYSDISPTSGTYTGPRDGQLITTKRAGLVAVE